MVEGLAQRGEEAIVGGRDDDRARLGLEALEGDELDAARRMPRRHLTRDAVRGEHAADPRERGLEQ